MCNNSKATQSIRMYILCHAMHCTGQTLTILAHILGLMVVVGAGVVVVVVVGFVVGLRTSPSHFTVAYLSSSHGSSLSRVKQYENDVSSPLHRTVGTVRCVDWWKTTSS